MMVSRIELKMDADSLLNIVVSHYAENVRKEHFNGVSLTALSLSISDDELSDLIVQLIRDRKLDCLSPPVLNPHIKRFPAPNCDVQIRNLNVADKYHTCLYPTSDVVKASIDLSFLDQKPFSRQLAEGEPQIEPLFFEVPVLDRYRQDPRYLFHFNGYQGHMSLSVPEDEYHTIPKRDQIFVESFGLGLDENGHPAVAVFRRYLSYLSADHQQYWNSFLFHGSAKIHKNYYKPSILGEFYENNSALAAIDLIIKEINRICVSIWGQPLFQVEIPDYPHYNLTPLMRPTRVDFLSFAHELDKLISENISKTAILLMIEDLNINTEDDTKKLGTLKLLDLYLFSGSIKWQNEKVARAEIVEPLYRLRKVRQLPAHTIQENRHDETVYDERREMLSDVVVALGSILVTLRKHPKAPAVDLPDWFEANDIEVL